MTVTVRFSVEDLEEIMLDVEYPCKGCKNSLSNGGSGRAIFEDVPCEWRCPSLDQYYERQREWYK